ncbi:MAG: energy transducer TonB [Acidobacteriales bacterium]|nr:energy transducer TonB [Terriglobales bacterium]
MLRSSAFLLFVASCMAFGQSPSQLSLFESHNPRDFFDAAAPKYNIEDPTLKPWHLKATYVVYDAGSKAQVQGTYEHWWASPKVYRNTWIRPGATHTDWHTADGKHAYRGEGVLDYFEYALQSSLLSPLPDETELDASKVRLERENITLGGVKLPCIEVIPHMQRGPIQQVPLGLFPTYCFDAKVPALRFEFSWGSLTVEFDKIVKMQGYYLPREIAVFEGKRKILTAVVDIIDGISASDPVLIPPLNLPASTTDKVQLGPSVTTGMLANNEAPIYPRDAKQASISGKVVLKALIGRDGAVHDLRIVETPWPSLAASALWAVSQWRYRPYLLN